MPLLQDPVDNLHHIILPAVILGTGLAAVIMRQTRSSMLDSLSHRLRPHGARPRACAAAR